MVGSMPESLDQSFNEPSVDEPPAGARVPVQSPVLPVGDWQVRLCFWEPWAAWGFGVPDSPIQDVRQAGTAARSPQYLPAHPLLPRCPQEKVSQLKEEVRLQYEKLHQLLDEDLRQTVEVLDKAQAKFCSENAAQALHLGERMQEAKKLLGSLQLLFDKTEDVSFMKVGWAWDRLVGPKGHFQGFFFFFPRIGSSLLCAGFL